MGPICLAVFVLLGPCHATVEAMETAKAWVGAEQGQLVRGAAWCRRDLTWLDRVTLEMTAKAKSLPAVAAIAAQFPNHVLSNHLACLSYRKPDPQPFQVPTIDDVPSFTVRQPPLVIGKTKRRSGRNVKSGWLKYRGNARPGSRLWPSNWHSMAAWRAAKKK